MTRTNFRHAWENIGLLVVTGTRKGGSAELPASRKFSDLFSTCFEADGTTHKDWVLSQSGLFDLLNNQK